MACLSAALIALVSSAAYSSVKVNFRKIRIFKTNGDGGSEEEWEVHGGLDLTIKTDFYHPENAAAWYDCESRASSFLSKLDGSNGCYPPDNTENSNDGFYWCLFNVLLDNVYVSDDDFDNGFKFHVQFQVGDWDAIWTPIGDIPDFDNGPTFDIDWTETKTTADLPYTRYFTRTGPEGRKARFYVEYTHSSRVIDTSDSSHYDECSSLALPWFSIDVREGDPASMTVVSFLALLLIVNVLTLIWYCCNSRKPHGPYYQKVKVADSEDGDVTDVDASVC